MNSRSIVKLFAAGMFVIFPAMLAFAQRPSEDRIVRIARQTVTVQDFKAEGYVLDIGGGGEGIIGRIKPKQVIAIDLMKEELQSAPAGPLKIIMDATDLKFLDGTFQTATSFFTLMFMKEPDQPKAMKEVFRVLAPGGRFLVWEVVIPERVDPKRDVFIVPLLVKLPQGEDSTGYGCLWPPKAHDMAYFVQMAEATGFKIVSKKQTDQTFFIELQKP